MRMNSGLRVSRTMGVTGIASGVSLGNWQNRAKSSASAPSERRPSFRSTPLSRSDVSSCTRATRSATTAVSVCCSTSQPRTYCPIAQDLLLHASLLTLCSELRRHSIGWMIAVASAPVTRVTSQPRGTLRRGDLPPRLRPVRSYSRRLAISPLSLVPNFPWTDSIAVRLPSEPWGRALYSTRQASIVRRPSARANRKAPLCVLPCESSVAPYCITLEAAPSAAAPARPPVNGARAPAMAPTPAAIPASPQSTHFQFPPFWAS